MALKLTLIVACAAMSCVSASAEILNSIVLTTNTGQTLSTSPITNENPDKLRNVNFTPLLLHQNKLRWSRQHIYEQHARCASDYQACSTNSDCCRGTCDSLGLMGTAAIRLISWGWPTRVL